MGYWSEVDILMQTDPYATLTTDIAPWWVGYPEAVTVELAA